MKAKHVVVTVPLGVLKTPSNVRFRPPLSDAKRAAIERVGVGSFLKVALLFDEAWWICQWGEKTVYYNVSEKLVMDRCILMSAPLVMDLERDRGKIHAHKHIRTHKRILHIDIQTLSHILTINDHIQTHTHTHTHTTSSRPPTITGVKLPRKLPL